MGHGSAERQRTQRPTMREVAAVAGVSLSTVSRVVNGGAGVRDDMAERVRAAVDMLGYRHNLTASILRRADRQSATIGLIFEDVSNPFFGAVHRGVEDYARARAAGLALAFVDRPPRFIDADAVVSDNVGGARAAVEHLIAAGDRRIGFLGDRPDVFTAAERLRGYREALASHDIAEDVDLVRHPQFRGVDAYETTAALLAGKNPPTALFSGQNLISMAAVRAIHAHGQQHEIALVGFDDIPMADVIQPGVTVVAQDPLALGRAAAELLFARIDGHDGPSREIVVPTRLVERGSGELPGPG